MVLILCKACTQWIALALASLLRGGLCTKTMPHCRSLHSIRCTTDRTIKLMVPCTQSDWVSDDDEDYEAEPSPSTRREDGGASGAKRSARVQQRVEGGEGRAGRGAPGPRTAAQLFESLQRTHTWPTPYEQQQASMHMHMQRQASQQVCRGLRLPLVYSFLS